MAQRRRLNLHNDGHSVARLIVYEGFIRKRSTIWSKRVGENVDNMLRTIEQMPGVGSSILPQSIRESFGPHVRKAVVSPYEIVYEYDEAGDVVYVYDLLYCPNVR